jgi:hypothetical protein
MKTLRVFTQGDEKGGGHVLGMGEMRNVYKILIGKPEGNRLLGISRHIYEDNSKKEC